MATPISTGLDFEETGLAHALTERSLTVPVNQRSYAWGENEVRRLLEDLTKAFDDAEDVYFLGAIVITKQGAQWQVADGQQRLATVSIMISAARDLLIELGDQQGAEKYQSKYLLEYNVRQKNFTPQLHLNFEDHDFFLATILNPPKDRKPYTGREYASHARLQAAATLTRDHVRNLVVNHSPKEKAERIYDRIEFLDGAARVFLISVPGSIGNAFKMFETLNARGLPASQMDILKNFLFDKAKDRVGTIHPRWMSMIGTIEELGEDDLLVTYVRHYWIAHHGPTIERVLGEKIEASIKSDRQAVDLVTSLDSFATDYVSILTPREHPRCAKYSRAARDCIHIVSRDLGVEQIRPLLLAITRSFSTKEAEKAFSLCLSWSVRLLIAGGGGGGVLDRHYGLRAMEVIKKEVTSAKELALRMSDVVPGDEVFKRAFAIASVRRTNLARYYLRALETHAKGEAHPQFVPSEDTAAVNLEHILPVNPSDQWDDIEPELAAAYYRRIGNMALMNSRANVVIGNDGFAAKRAVFRGSPYELTAEIAKLKKMGPTEIDRRQQRLAELAPGSMAHLMDVSADQLQQAVESQHGGKATLASVEPVLEVFQGQVVWEGVVHVFDLEGHPRATRAYAWSHLVGDTGERRRFYAVLHLGGIRSPLDAVRAAIVAERKERK